jgi:SAM-dependent methyltransferase/aryl carrier-like protein
MQARGDAAHGEMRAVLFGRVDMHKVRRVVDIGCGYATDLMELAQVHGHLVLDGCNISEDQIDLGRRKLAQAGLDGRVRLHHLDSARSEFPGLYDLAISHQVIHHIRDKDGVLRNVSEHLRNGGFLVAAEIVSNLDEPIDHALSSAHFETKQNWAQLLARHQLRLARCVDASAEIGNYLHDADFARTLRDNVGEADASTLAHLHGPHALGGLLRKGLASYLLLLVQRDQFCAGASLLAENAAQLERPVSYADARRALAVPGQVSTDAAPVLPLAQPAVQLPAAPAAAAGGIPGIVAELLECAADALDPEQPLVAQGLNSILAMCLSKCLKEAYGLGVPVKGLLNGESIASLSKRLPAGQGAAPAAEEVPQVQPIVTRNAPAVGADLLRSVGALSEAEVDGLLVRLTARGQPS